MLIYAHKQATAQKKDAPTAASILDTSSQSESLQRKADMANSAAQREEAPRPNNTGMPDNLKSGIESLSGFSMDDVRVHYNSSKPAAVQALAYTQGTDIHVAPGQEKHLPHEAWHVAQQMAGRVSPTTNINGMPVNDNAALEHEADVMGEKAIGLRFLKEKKGVNKTKNIVAFQRKVPSIEDKNTLPALGGSKPEAKTVPYNPTGEKDYNFSTKRSNFYFIPNRKNYMGTRCYVFSKYNFRNSAVMTGGGYSADIRGVQLDHSPISWEKIAKGINENNRMATDDSSRFSLADAKLYYNDFENLVPEFASTNASAGDKSANGLAPLNQSLSDFEIGIEELWISIKNQLSYYATFCGAMTFDAYQTTLQYICNLITQLETFKNEYLENATV